MKNNQLCRLLFSIFLGAFSVTHVTTANAGSVSDEIIAAANALIPEARERLIRSCRTINQPGAYSLIRNLSSTGDCLIVNADHVTIDLNGFVISGLGSVDDSDQRVGTGISGSINLGLHIRNGTITGFGSAVYTPNSDYSSFKEMNIIRNDSGIDTGKGSRITNSIYGVVN